MKRTFNQNKQLHALLLRLGLMDHKEELISFYTHGRTKKSSQMTFHECQIIIKQLVSVLDEQIYWKSNLNNCLRKKIFSLAREFGLIYGSSKQDNKMNFTKINLFLERQGSVKKKINELTTKELKSVIKQFHAIKKKISKKQQDHEIEELLSDMGISFSQPIKK